MDEKKIPLALFDFDGTMIRGDSIVPFLSHARKRGAVGMMGYLKGCFCGGLFVLHLMDGGKAKKKALSFYQHLDDECQKSLDQSFAEQYLLPKVYKKAKDTVSEHKKNGLHTILVSASTENYMQYVYERLGFSALICTKMDEKGRVMKNCHGAEKVIRIEEYLQSQGIHPDFSVSFAYGDSRGDLPMLKLCGHPVKVNPKKALQKAAPEMEEACWQE